MSNRTNQPLPVIGAQNWGSTLNNYLRNQEYGRLELEQDLSDLYAQQSTVVQTVLSSGVMDKSVSGKKPGLYDNAGTFIGEGVKLDFTKKYYYRGYAAVLGSTTINGLIGGGEGGLEIVSPALTEAVDARCAYAHYDISNNSWSLKFGDTETPSTETSISLNPYYICIGVIIKINSNYYWHYKTMKSNLSISSKKWMLDEPHASLSTYMFMNGGRIGVYYDDDGQLSGVLTTQALGINPFTSTETITNELGGDLRTTTIASKAGGYNFSVLLIKSTTSGTNTTYGTTFYADGNSVLPLNSNKYYRLSATSILIEDKVLFLMQEEISSSSVDRTIFSDESFNRLWYYSDPVELYRIKGSTMTASPGNGLSPINANGIDPHVTTLIKYSDNVLFGETTGTAFKFNTTGASEQFTVNVPRPYQGNSSWMLTNNMDQITQPINIHNYLSLAGGSDVDNYIKMYRGDSAANYHNITLATHQGGEGAYAHFTGQGYIKLGTYQGSSSFDVNSGTPDASIYIKSKNRGTADGDSNIQLKAEYIDNYADSITEVTENWQANYGGTDPKAYCAIQYRDNRSLFSLGVDSGKTITMTTDGEATEKPCIQVGGGCKLSSDGLTLPSANSGVKISSIVGKTTSNGVTSLNCSISTTYSYASAMAAKFSDTAIYYPDEFIPLSFNDSIGISEPSQYRITDIRWIDVPGSNNTIFYMQLPDNNDRYKCVFSTNHPINTANKCPSDLYFIALIDTVPSLPPAANFNVYYNRSEKSNLLSIKTVKDTLIDLASVESNSHISINKMHTGTSASFVSNNDGTIRLFCNAHELSVKHNSKDLTIAQNEENGVVTIGKNVGEINISNSTGKIKLENSVVTTFKTKIGKRVAVATDAVIPSSVLEFYESFMSMIPSETTPSITLRNRYHRLGFPTAISTDFNGNNYVKNATSIDKEGPTIQRGYFSDNTALSQDFRGDNPRNHEWIKINIQAGLDSKTDGWAKWTIWALTGVQNRYRWLYEDEFYFQTGTSGSSACKYFEIDYRYNALPTGSSYTNQLTGYMRNNWYTCSPTSNNGDLDLTLQVFMEDPGASSLSPALADSNNLDAGLKNDIKALNYAIDADFGTYPILWHLITKSDNGSVGRYKVYLDWSNKSDYYPSKDLTGKVHAPYAYDIHSRK